MSDPRTGQTDPTRPIRLGPFVLQEPIGRGGMGLVWRGWHHERGVPVAVKIMDTKVEDIDRTFRNEVQAVARLDHPGVVWVYDVGQIDRAAADASRGRLTTNCPYIAMEYASRGTLKDWGRLPWEGVREVLLALLDAMAHAHARGVIHRDLKPANVLVCGPEDLRQGLKLADFGIAHALEQRQPTGLAAGSQKTAIGTVQYMAPEQIRVEHQDTGPWTDIYALGNVTWQLLTGKIPFSQYSGVALVRAQLDEPLPDPIGPKLPDGFVEWLRKCVAKNPQDRFQRCADAAEALLSLGESRERTGRLVDVLDRLPTVRVELGDEGVTTNPVTGAMEGAPRTEGIQLHTGLVSLTLSASGQKAARSTTTTGSVSPRVPSDWRRPDLPRPSFSLLGAGMALYDVRQPPMVGRMEEVDVLWNALREVARTGRPDLVLVTGPTGIGKTRLCRFLGERAHELGAATVLTARFFEEDSEDGAIRRMWARYLRMNEVESAQRARWLVKVLARHQLYEPEKFAILVGPGPSDRRREQSEVMIRAMTQDRPVILVLDDVDATTDGIALAQRLMAAETPFPVLVIGCARTEVMEEHSERVKLVEELGRRHKRLELGPLPPRHSATLIEEALGLSPALAAQVTERTGGNPRFARKLIGDWVKRGVLVLGPTGFEVRRGEVLDLPASLRDVWAERVEHLLSGFPEKGPTMLERAAVLGLEFDVREWQRACDDPEGGWAAAGRQRVVPDNERLRQELVSRLMAVRVVSVVGEPEEPTAYRFAHGMIREVLLGRAKTGGRWAEHHRACATILRFNEDAEASAERIGRHLLEAGAVEESIDPLLQGVVFRRDRAGARSALGLVATAEEALRSLHLETDDPRWGEAWQLRAMLIAELGEVGEAERVAKKVIDREGIAGWLPHALDARTTIARMHAAMGDLVGADRELEHVEQTSTDPVQQGLASAERALIAARLRDKERARRSTDAAIRLLRRAASSRALAECWRVVGMTALMLKNERQAEDALARSLRLYKLRGNMIGQADCLTGLGRSAIQRGNLDQAEDRLKEAIHLYEVAGTGEVVRPKADLGRLRLQCGRWDEGRELLQHVRHALARQGRSGVVEGLGAFQLWAAAGLGDWDEFDHRIRLIEADPGNELGEDGKAPMADAIRLADAAGKKERAARAQQILDALPKTTGRRVAS